MASGVIVFDDSPLTGVEDGSTGRPFVVISATEDILVFDADHQVTDETQTGTEDFLVFDAPAPSTSEMQAPEDFMLIDAPKNPATVVLEDNDQTDIIILTTSGLPGPPGPGNSLSIGTVDTVPPGTPSSATITGSSPSQVLNLVLEQGEKGLDGPGAYYQEFNFASAATTWTIVHNQNTFALSVELVDSNGDPMEGYVQYTDANTITVEWYYATAGAARVFR